MPPPMNKWFRVFLLLSIVFGLTSLFTRYWFDTPTAAKTVLSIPREPLKLGISVSTATAPMAGFERNSRQRLAINKEIMYPQLHAESCRPVLWSAGQVMKRNDSKTFVVIVPNWDGSTSTRNAIRRKIDAIRYVSRIPITILFTCHGTKSTCNGTISGSDNITSVRRKGIQTKAEKDLEAELRGWRYDPNLHVQEVTLPFNVSLLPLHFIQVHESIYEMHAENIKKKRKKKWKGLLMREDFGQNIFDYIVFHAFGLPFDKVVVLSLDTHVEFNKGIDHLFDCDADLLYTGGVDGFIVHPNILVLRANSLQTVRDMTEVLISVAHSLCFTAIGCSCTALNTSSSTSPTTTTATTAAAAVHVSNSNASIQFINDRSFIRTGEQHQQCITMNQMGAYGFLEYFFIRRWDPQFQHHRHQQQEQQQLQQQQQQPPSGLNEKARTNNISLSRKPIVARISSCLYNYHPQNMDNHCHRNYALGIDNKEEKRGLIPYISISRSKALPPISSTSKPCTCDFWILGARKAGTTALYYWMTEHPEIARLHFNESSGRGGEVLAHIGDVGTYNKQFEEAKQASLISGDAAVSRLANDAYTLPLACGHSHVKHIALLRNPIERLYSNVMMQIRDGTRGLTEDTNVTNHIMLHLRLFKEKERNHPNWVDELIRRSSSSSSSSSSVLPHLFPPMGSHSGNLIYEGVYYVFVQLWLQSSGVDNLRLYFTEDFSAHTELIVKDALRHVGVTNVTNWYPSQKSFNFVANARNKSITVPEHQKMTPLLISLLRSAYAPYNRMLESQLNRTVPWGY